MSYRFFGNNSGKPSEELLHEAKKQKMAEDIVHAITSPISFIAKKGVKKAIGSKQGIISDEQYTKALILKVMRDHDLVPRSRFEKNVKQLVREVLREELKESHPMWQSILSRKKK